MANIKQGGNTPIVLDFGEYRIQDVDEISIKLFKQTKDLKGWTKDEIEFFEEVVEEVTHYKASLPLTQEETLSFPIGLAILECKFEKIGSVTFADKQEIYITERQDKTIFEV